MESRHLTAKHETQHDQHTHHAGRHMEGVEAHQRVVRCAKEITADGQVVAHDQLVPLIRRAQQKNHAQHNGG